LLPFFYHEPADGVENSEGPSPQRHADLDWGGVISTGDNGGNRGNALCFLCFLLFIDSQIARGATVDGSKGSWRGFDYQPFPSSAFILPPGCRRGHESRRLRFLARVAGSTIEASRRQGAWGSQAAASPDDSRVDAVKGRGTARRKLALLPMARRANAKRSRGRARPRLYFTTRRGPAAQGRHRFPEPPGRK